MKGTLIYMKGTLIYLKGILIYMKGTLIYMKGTLIYMKGTLIYFVKKVLTDPVRFGSVAWADAAMIYCTFTRRRRRLLGDSLTTASAQSTSPLTSRDTATLNCPMCRTKFVCFLVHVTSPQHTLRFSGTNLLG